MEFATTDQWLERVRTLNDDARRRLTDGVVFATSGITAFPDEDLAAILDRVRTFEEFTPDNDPHGEHDFGAFSHKDARIFWKIDCYDRSGQFASFDAANPVVTKRVLTIMLAEEY